MRHLRNAALATAALLCLAPLPSLPALAQADDIEAYGDEYQAGDYGRVKYVENGLTVRRSVADPSGSPEETAGINTPLFPDDSAVTGNDQRAEIELAGGTLLRLDRASELTFLSLPAPYAAIADNTVLQLAEGSLRVTAILEGEEEFRIDTPAASVYLLGDGEFRIDVDGKGATRVMSRRGVAEIAGNQASVLVRGGMRADAYPGSVPSDPVAFNTFATDGFDRWVARRDDAYRKTDRYADYDNRDSGVYEELPDEVRPHYRELSSHGDWVRTDDYGYVWSPSEVATTWRPYYDGHWAYGPHGYFWVSNEPWGWAPYRYGRWTWVGGTGWCWIPGRVFAGAWVAWSWGSVHVGWSALDYWNRPVYVTGYNYGYYDSRCWTFVNYNHIHHRHYPRYAVSVNHIDHHQLRDTAVVTRPPRVSPRQLSESADRRRQAVRATRADRTSQIRTPDRASRSGRTLADVDARLARRGAERANRASVVESRVSRSSSGEGRATRGNTRAVRTGPSASSGREDSARRPAVTTPRYPRRTPETDTGARRSVRSRTASTPSARRPTRTRTTDEGSTTRPQVRPRNVREDAADAKRRSMYERLAGPRKTQDRSESGTTTRTPTRTRSSSGTPSTRSRETTRTRDKKPEARRNTPPPKSGQRATPRREPAAKKTSPKRKDAEASGRSSSSTSRRSPSVTRTPTRRVNPPKASSRSSSSPTRRSPAASRTPTRRVNPPKASNRSSSSPTRRSPAASKAPARRSTPKASSRSSSPSRRAPAAKKAPARRSTPKASSRSSSPSRRAPAAKKAPARRPSPKASGSKSNARKRKRN